MVKNKLISFATIVRVASWTLVTLLITVVKLIRILLKWKQIQRENYAIFGRYDAKAEFLSGHPGWSVQLWENFHPDYRDLGRKNQDLGNWAGRASCMSYERMKFFTIKSSMRRDLGN